MLLGMALLRLAVGRPLLTWAAFWALTWLHVWANVRAMRCLRITGLNQARLGLLLRHWLCEVRTAGVHPRRVAAVRILRGGTLRAQPTPLLVLAPPWSQASRLSRSMRI